MSKRIIPPEIWIFFSNTTKILRKVLLCYKIKYGPELSLNKAEEKDQIILDWTQEMEKHIESIIRKNPAPWMCGHRRWKTRPQGEENFY